MTKTMVSGVMAELAVLEDTTIREANERHGDDHGVKLGKLRALAPALGKRPEMTQVTRTNMASWTGISR